MIQCRETCNADRCMLDTMAVELNEQIYAKVDVVLSALQSDGTCQLMIDLICFGPSETI